MKAQQILILLATLYATSTMCQIVMDETAGKLNTSGSAVSSVIPTGSVAVGAISSAASLPATSAALPTAAVSSVVVSDIVSVQSSFVSAASSWAASVASIPAATFAVSSKAPAPSVSVARPYAGPSVISASNHLEASFGIVAMGILAFAFTLL